MKDLTNKEEVIREIVGLVVTDKTNSFGYYYLEEMLNLYNEVSNTNYRIFHNGLELAVLGTEKELIEIIENCGFKDWHNNGHGEIILGSWKLENFNEENFYFLSDEGYYMYQIIEDKMKINKHFLYSNFDKTKRTYE